MASIDATLIIEHIPKRVRQTSTKNQSANDRFSMVYYRYVPYEPDSYRNQRERERGGRDQLPWAIDDTSFERVQSIWGDPQIQDLDPSIQPRKIIESKPFCVSWS